MGDGNCLIEENVAVGKVKVNADLEILFFLTPYTKGLENFPFERKIQSKVKEKYIVHLFHLFTGREHVMFVNMTEPEIIDLALENISPLLNLTGKMGET